MENCEVPYLLLHLGSNFIDSQNGLYIPGSEGTCVLEYLSFMLKRCF